MRMTQTLIDAVTSAVIRDLPLGRDFDSEAASLVHAAALKKIPKELHEWIEKRPDLFNQIHVWTPGSLSTIVAFGSNQVGRRDIVDESPTLKEKLQVLSTGKYEAQKAVSELCDKVRRSLAGFTTTKQAKEAMPELAKYFPEDSERPGANLPAIQDTVESLKKAGWPAKFKARSK